MKSCNCLINLVQRSYRSRSRHMYDRWSRFCAIATFAAISWEQNLMWEFSEQWWWSIRLRWSLRPLNAVVSIRWLRLQIFCAFAAVTEIVAKTRSQGFSVHFVFAELRYKGGCDQESNYPRNKALIVVIVLLIFVGRKVKINLNFLWQINYIWKPFNLSHCILSFNSQEKCFLKKSPPWFWCYFKKAWTFLLIF